jgi:hypothetical protein
LLESVNTTLQQIGEYIFLKAGRAIWNLLQDGALENIDPALPGPDRDLYSSR